MGNNNKNFSDYSSGLSVSQTFGIILFAFSVFILCCTAFGNTVFGSFGGNIQAFFVGFLGYFSFAVFAALAVLGFALTAKLKLRVFSRGFVFGSLMLLSAVAILQLVTSSSLIEGRSFVEYTSLCYQNGLSGLAYASCGGCVFAAVVFPFVSLLGTIGSYVAFGLLFCLWTFFAVDVSGIISASAERKGRSVGMKGSALPRLEYVDYDLGDLADVNPVSSGNADKKTGTGLFVTDADQIFASNGKNKKNGTSAQYDIPLGNVYGDRQTVSGETVSKLEQPLILDEDDKGYPDSFSSSVNGGLKNSLFSKQSFDTADNDLPPAADDLKHDGDTDGSADEAVSSDRDDDYDFSTKDKIRDFLLTPSKDFFDIVVGKPKNQKKKEVPYVSAQPYERHVHSKPIKPVIEGGELSGELTKSKRKKTNPEASDFYNRFSVAPEDTRKQEEEEKKRLEKEKRRRSYADFLFTSAPNDEPVIDDSNEDEFYSPPTDGKIEKRVGPSTIYEKYNDGLGSSYNYDGEDGSQSFGSMSFDGYYGAENGGGGNGFDGNADEAASDKSAYGDNASDNASGNGSADGFFWEDQPRRRVIQFDGSEGEFVNDGDGFIADGDTASDADRGDDGVDKNTDFDLDRSDFDLSGGRRNVSDAYDDGAFDGASAEFDQNDPLSGGYFGKPASDFGVPDFNRIKKDKDVDSVKDAPVRSADGDDVPFEMPRVSKKPWNETYSTMNGTSISDEMGLTDDGLYEKTDGQQAFIDEMRNNDSDGSSAGMGKKRRRKRADVEHEDVRGEQEGFLDNFFVGSDHDDESANNAEIEEEDVKGNAVSSDAIEISEDNGSVAAEEYPSDNGVQSEEEIPDFMRNIQESLRRAKEQSDQRELQKSQQQNAKPEQKSNVPRTPHETAPYKAPPIELLKPSNTATDEDEDLVREKAKKLEEILDAFKIPAEVRGWKVGPTFTRFEVKIPLGIPVSRIVGLSSDMALHLSTKGGVIIEAPIPGKDLIGIELANEHRATVALRNVIESDEYSNAKDPLSVPVGMDLERKIHMENIAKMPHLLVAGSTGSGKSAFLNSLIVSLLYRTGPDDVRFILIDPKRVEFPVYDKMPHLVIDKIITDYKEALGAFTWAINEMTRRLDLFSGKIVNDIDSYNKARDPETEEKLFRIVIIVDEFAELIMSPSGGEIEKLIQRLTQLARATGIHVILATQRPSVDVITGVIKSNLPTRVALSVISVVDSKTILDTGGAENLLGYGDLLLKTTTARSNQRLQSPFIDIEDVNKVVEYIKNNNETYFDETINNEMFSDNSEEEVKDSASTKNVTVGTLTTNIELSPDTEDGRLLIKILKIGVDAGTISISSVLRHFHIGYARAGKFVFSLERLGLVEHQNSSKSRKVYMTPEQFRSQFGDVNIFDE